MPKRTINHIKTNLLQVNNSEYYIMMIFMIYTGNIIQCKLEADEGQECIPNFCGETSWKTEEIGG
jgi:hypothetical protein